MNMGSGEIVWPISRLVGTEMLAFLWQANQGGKENRPNPYAEYKKANADAPGHLHPAPCTLNFAPCTLNPELCTLHPAPCTLHPEP
jgi:hypothetical protein